MDEEKQDIDGPHIIDPFPDAKSEIPHSRSLYFKITILVSATFFLIVTSLFAWFLLGNNDKSTIVKSSGEEQANNNEGKIADVTNEIEESKKSNTFLSQATSSGRVFFEKMNFEYTVPSGYTPDIVGQFIPQGLEGMYFAYMNENKNCGFAYMRMNDDDYRTRYKETSFAERIFTTAENTQLDGRYKAPAESLGADFEFGWERRIPKQGEIRSYPYQFFYSDQDPQTNFFALYTLDNSPISYDCDQDFSTFLRSIASRYDPTEINNNTNGALYVNKDGIFLIDATDSVIRFLFNTDLLPNRLFYYKDKLITASGSTISSINLYTGEVTTLVTVQDKIGDLIINNDGTIYYSVIDKDCNSNDGSCDASVFSYDIETKNSQKLINDFKYNIMLGFSPDSSILYIYKGYGDAGCLWVEIVGIQLANSELLEPIRYSGCYNYDPDTNQSFEDEDLVKYDQFRATLQEQKEYNHLMIQDGVIKPPSDNIYLARPSYVILIVAQDSKSE